MAVQQTTNLIQGTGLLYWGLVGATEPLDASINTTPAASAWNEVGFTQDGVTLAYAPTWSELAVDQIVDIPERRLVKREFTIATNMAEATLDNLALAINESVSATATGIGTLDPGAGDAVIVPTYRALIFDGIAPGTGKRRRVVLRRGLPTENVEMAYKKDGQTLVPVSFAAHFVSTSIKPWHIVDDQS